MAKRKNPLQDIDAFLSQEATNLVTPDTVSGDAHKSKPQATVTPSEQKPDVYETLLNWAQQQDQDFRPQLYDLMLKTLEELSASSAKDKMLINTLLYLKNPESWKESVKEYWS